VKLLQLLIFLLACALALGWFSRRAGLPYPIALVIGGGLLGFVPGLPQLELDPQFLLVLVLPPILYQAALLTSWRDFRANVRQIGLLSIGLVIVTTILVGAALKFLIPDIPWAAAFAFGAIVSPPDAVAATAILSKLNMPRRIVTVLEGESLVNDASGLVLYKFAVAAVIVGGFSIFDAGLQFVLISALGVAVGVVIAGLFVMLHRHIGDAFIEVLVSLSIPYICYVGAEVVHSSGVLAVVAAGLVRGRYAPAIVSAEMRILARSVWNILVFMLNSLIFILIGLQVSAALSRIQNVSGGDLAADALAVSLVAILVRFAWVYVVEYIPTALGKLTGLKAEPPLPGEAFVVSWCGMRGIVSLAAALALPVQIDDGNLFPHRDLIIFLTFVVIFVTLVVQGLTLAPIIRRLSIGSDRGSRDEHDRARLAMCNAALASIDKYAAEGTPPELLERLRAEVSERMVAHSAKTHQPEDSGTFSISSTVRRAAVRAERDELIRIWRAGEISDEVLHHIEEELDYEESRL
jgi:CPA1 family monovalent cation:H+ antiporter